MAITAQQRTDIVKITVAMFGATPGGYLAELETMFTASGSNIATFAATLANTDAFKNQTAYANKTNEEKATAMAAAYGLTDVTTVGSAGKQAYDYFLGELTAGTNMGYIFAAANNFLATTTNADFTATKTYLKNKTTVAEYYLDSGLTSTDVPTLQSKISSVTSDAATVTAAKTAIDTEAFNATAIQLTTGTDSKVGTAGNDFYNAAAGTLGTADTILDSSSTDADLLKIETTDSTGSVTPRIQNVETIKINGSYVGVGFDLANVSGTQNLDLSTSIVGGTAKVTNAFSINALNVNAGTNISVLEVTSSASGTRDTVKVNAGSASTVTLTGASAGLDSYEVTVAKGATLNLNGAGTLDTFTANVGSTVTLKSTTPTAAKTVTVNAAEATTVTLDSAMTATAENLGNVDFAGAGNVTVNTAVASIDAQAMTSTGTGTLTVVVSDDAATKNLKGIQADTVKLNAAQTGTVTVNGNSAVNLVKTGSQTINVDNAGTTAMTAGSGTLNLKVSNSQTAVTTGANVGTLLLEATPDEASDTASGAKITLTSLSTDANTKTVVVSGTSDIAISDVTDGADLVITASQLTGKFTLGQTGTNTNNLTVVSGQNNDTLDINIATAKTGIVLAGAGNDTLTATGAGTAVIKLYGEDGNDTITGAAVASILDGGAGNDTITGGAAADTISGGTGDDVINGAGGADTISTGTGADKVIIASTEGEDTISDAEKGVDTIILRGGSNAGAAVDVTALTVSSGSYAAKLGTNHSFTLTGFTATDLSDTIQFGDSTTAYTAAGFDLKTGAKNDVIQASASDVSIDAGAGDDIITTGGALTNGKLTGGVGNDTFSIGHNANIADLGTGDILKVTGAATATASVTSDFTATSATSIATGGAVTMKLANGINVDLTNGTLAASTLGYTIKAMADGTTANTAASTIKASNGADSITGGDGKDVILAGEGTDTITVSKGGDEITLTEQVSVADTVRIDTIASSTGSANSITLVNFVSGVDKINFKQGAASLTGVTTDGTGDAVSTMAAVVTNTTSVATIADVYTALAAYTTLTASAADGTATVAQAYKFDNGAAAGTYVVVNDATAGFQTATDVVIKLSGLTTIAAGDFTFTA